MSFSKQTKSFGLYFIKGEIAKSREKNAFNDLIFMLFLIKIKVTSQASN